MYQGDTQYFEVEISPHLQLETGEVSMITVPLNYIIEDISNIVDTDAGDEALSEGSDTGYTPDTPVGGGKYSSQINSSVYKENVITQLLNDLNKILYDCFKIIYNSEFDRVKPMR